MDFHSVPQNLSGNDGGVDCAIRLRAGGPEDAEAMYALDLLCFSEAFRFERSLMRRLVGDPAGIVTVAECRAGLVGFAMADVRRVRGGARAYLSTLDVAPEHRRGGLGSRLMEETERRCAEAGALRMSLHVWVENGAAIAFYKRSGYTRRGRRVVGYYGAAGDGWAYRKTLVPGRCSGEDLFLSRKL